MTLRRFLITLLVLCLTLVPAGSAAATAQETAPVHRTPASGEAGDPIVVEPPQDAAGSEETVSNVFCTWDPYWIDYALDWHQTGAHGQTHCSPATDQQVRVFLQTRRWWGGWETVDQVFYPEQPWVMSGFSYNGNQIPQFSMPQQNGTWRVHQEFWFTVDGNFALRATSTSPNISCSTSGCSW